MNDAKILDITKRVMRVTTVQKATVAEVAAVHINCLVSLAIEAAGGDKNRAAGILRGTFYDAAAELEKPGLTVRQAVHEGKPIKDPERKHP